MRFRNKAGAALLAILYFLSSCIPCYALTDIYNAFCEDPQSLFDSFSEGFGWEKEKMRQYSWENNGKEYTRKSAFQYEYYQDHIKTTRSYLYGFSGGGDGEMMVSCALGELGVCETPSGSDIVKYNNWYHNDPTYVPGPGGWGWCAVFVCWCAEQCGILGEGNIFEKTAWPPSVYSHLISQGFCCYSTQDTTPMGGSAYTPVPGDIMFFWSENEYRWGHVAIIKEVGSNYITTIGGNEGINGVVKLSTYDRAFVQSGSASALPAKNGCIIAVEYP